MEEDALSVLKDWSKHRPELSVRLALEPSNAAATRDLQNARDIIFASMRVTEVTEATFPKLSRFKASIWLPAGVGVGKVTGEERKSIDKAIQSAAYQLCVRLSDQALLTDAHGQPITGYLFELSEHARQAARKKAADARTLANTESSAPLVDPVGRLITLSQKSRIPAPEYVTENDREGFKCTCTYDGKHKGVGTGSTKQKAKKQAAEAVLASLRS
jgi:hypothetical protein